MYDATKPASLTPPPLNIPNGWEVTAWIQMSDFAFGKKDKTFYGFVLRQTDDHYSHALVVRGTEGVIEWYDDAVCVPTTFKPAPKAGAVSSGFDQIYSTMQLVRLPRPAAAGTLSDADAQKLTVLAGTPDNPVTFADQVETLLDTMPATVPPRLAGIANRKHDFVVTGHSLGGALTTLYTMEHAVKKRADPSRRVRINTLCTFASPRVGTQQFVQAFDAIPIDSWRIVNEQDLVPKVPPHVPEILPYEHVDTAYPFDSRPVVKGNPVCWHSMKTYLHWLDETIAVDPTCALTG